MVTPHPLSQAVRRPAMRGAAVELRGVTKRYADVSALAELTLTIGEGEFFSLLGPSGCGKTTTLNVIGGFVEPDTGDILIQNRSVVGQPPYLRPVNTVFQNYALFPHMTVTQNIAFGLRMRRTPSAEIAGRVRDALALVSLERLGDRRPAQLSGGQQQRVALARALVNQPAVLLLDEPLGALDLKLRKQMQLELSRIQQEIGITFVYVTHDQEEAMTMSDRIAVMDRGCVVQVGTPRTIYERPANSFVADFIGASNILHGEVVGREAAAIVVRLGDDALIRAPLAEIGAGQRVSVVVRPDRMAILEELNQPAQRDMNALKSSVTKVAYLGTHAQIVVTLRTGTVLTVHAPSAASGEPVLPTVGEDVYIAWPIAYSMCFER